MTTPKQCAAAGTHDGQPWQCERDAASNGVCMAHLMQYRRTGAHAPLRVRPTSPGVAVAVHLPEDLAAAVKAKADAEGLSVSALGRRALVRFLDDFEATS